MSNKVLIVGGVAGGASAAARLRRLDEEAHIVMFERDEHISFANCGLPYYIGDNIKDRSKLIVQTPEAMYKRFNLDIRTQSEVTGINTIAKTVQVKSRAHGVYEESYDYLILAPGAKPIRPDLPGIDSSRIYTLRNLADTDRIKKHVSEVNSKSAVVIGGGFIGVEMAENLKEAGLDVTLVQADPQLLAPFDREMSHVLARELEGHGVQLLFSESAKSFKEADDYIKVELASGATLTADMVILAIGVTPDTSFLNTSGIALTSRGHIIVNDHLETNIEGVYAVGDAIQVVDYINGSKTAIPLAGPANKQGRIAADNVCGLGVTYQGSQGTSIIKVFGLTGATTGNNEKTLQRLGIPYQVAYVHPSSHASYYPGAVPLTLKLIFDDKGTLLGAQAVGSEGVDKRIDDIATVIHFRGTVSDLTGLELSYAPPFSSAKDPVNMAGYTAENILAGRTKVFVPEDLTTRDAGHTLLVDVRSELEHNNGHIPGSILIPVDELRSRLGELDPGKEIWVYCQVGLRGYTASRILQQKGYQVRNLTGGYKTYRMFQYTPSGNSTLPAVPAFAEIRTETAAAAQQQEDRLHADLKLDACGLSCPGPLIQVKQQMDKLNKGQMLHVTASDPGFHEDITAWARLSGNQLISAGKTPGGMIEAWIRKGGPDANLPDKAEPQQQRLNGSSMVVFSGDLDKAIASFIIANGAASSGKKVTMFFTFWGLNVIRKPEKVPVTKSFTGRMFGTMMPRGSSRLTLSKLNMLGLGTKMIRGVMKGKNISSLEELIQSAIQQGVEVVACSMSMDVMGITEEELIDGVKIGGVGYYLGQAEQSGLNLFI
ncbi:FAD-dependent oxidoreductase [Paenibacillus sp. MMS20-IR301]|uniref:FAD-dependent oxidoreductase n=1 Tax=Paenibacillus sp. MMS20-IR301 TaxID=2895946 RepID=UPI0028E30C5B|nr:FAD-dependent oxidoreductase [Paenibacillus sp. MMS20-IR301]WNS40799.1 FAD-dependent oxidoreductase [Paenibacillus sp. MMS20-IR301]